jgi:hypothetical protein
MKGWNDGTLEDWNDGLNRKEKTKNPFSSLYPIIPLFHHSIIPID